MNKMLKSKKGISPILTTLLIIVVAVAAVIVTYAWVMTFVRTQTQAASAILAEDNVRFYNKTTNVRDGLGVTIKNIGSADAEIVRIYLGTSSANLIDVTSNASDLGTGKALPVDDAVTINVSWPNLVGTEWDTSTTYYFKVVPETGASLEFSKKSTSA